MPRWTAALLVAGTSSAVAAAVADPAGTGSAASQVWPAFVLVAGLLLIGLVAAEDGLFAAVGQRLGRTARSDGLLLAGVAVLVAGVTAVLNLDTSVAFLTPVLAHTSEQRRSGGVMLVPACLLLSNAGSLLLPGSNLTNLIVLGHLHMPGGRFATHMGLPWIAAAVVTGAVVAVAARRRSRPRGGSGSRGGPHDPVRADIGVGLLAIVAAVAVILTVSSPAPVVLAIGVAAVGLRVARGRIAPARTVGVLDLPVLGGLFGLAVAVGTLGRNWSFPASHLAHAGPWATAGVGALSAVLINNLPAASLLSARPPAHPLSLLIGLNVGPNLFVSGSLAWVLWYNSARAAGSRPDVWQTVRLGLVAAPLSIVAAVGALLATNGLT